MRTPEAISKPALEQDAVRTHDANQVFATEQRGKQWLARSGAALIFFVLSLSLQWLGGAYRSEFAGFPDEAAHYITGLMVRDYVAHGHFRSFRNFAENYYLHYPKVALGHWPPFFYVVEGTWMLLFPISRVSMLILMAIIATLLAFLLYRVVEQEYGALIGVMVGMLLVAIPVVQQYGSMVMADTLVGLLSLAATIIFSSFMDSGRRASAIWFGLLASMTILTKGTGIALALVPPFALLLTDRWGLARRLNFWLPLVIVVPLCAPWYWITRHMLPNTWEQTEPGLHFALGALHYYAWHSFRVFGGVIVVVAVIGFFAKVIVPARRAVASKWAALAALVIATYILDCIVPAGLEDRFLIPAIPAVLAFMVAGVDYVATRLFRDRLTPHSRRLAVLIPTIVIFLGTTFSVPRSVSSGFAAIANQIVSDPALSKAVVLISSDPIGDGMLVSDLAMREQRPGHYVLRGTKVLCDCSWTGSRHSARYPTAQATMSYLEQTPIQIVVDDVTVPAITRMEFNDVLEETIRAYPERWQLLASYPITRNGVVYPQGARVYRLLGTNPSLPVTIDLHRMLNRSIQLRPEQ